MPRRPLIISISLTLVAAIIGALLGLWYERKQERQNLARAQAGLQTLTIALWTKSKLEGKLPTTDDWIDAGRNSYGDRLRPTSHPWPKDPWGHRYRYRFISQTPPAYDLYSLGPDGIPSADDIHAEPLK